LRKDILMAAERAPALLGPNDPAPVRCCNAPGRAPFLLTGDHAGGAIPRQLGTLGLEAHDLARHIAIDIGIAGLGEALSERLDAVFLAQAYSRLVIDCNRDPASADAMPEVSDGTTVPGNRALSSADREARIAAIHDPYQQRIAAEIAERAARGQETVLIALHSFTPVMSGVRRKWDVGVLHEGGDESFARRLLAALAREPGLTVGDNQPYHMDQTDHSVPRHAFPNHLRYAEIEIRQDLIADPAGQHHWAELLFAALDRAQHGT
jgi:predicted N-formylglutamate amidohydrolase